MLIRMSPEWQVAGWGLLTTLTQYGAGVRGTVLLCAG